MRAFFLVAAIGFVSFGGHFFGCGAGTGLIVIPPEVEQTVVPEEKTQGVHAVYLYDIAHAHFDPMENSQWPAYVYSRYSKIKLLTRAATELEHYGNISVRHAGALLDIGGYVQKPDGTRRELQKGDFFTNVLIRDVVPDAVPPIDFIETVIVFPGLEVGDTIAYHYAQRGRDPAWIFNRPDAPVLYSKFMVARPPYRVEIQPLLIDRHNLKPEHSEDKGVAAGMTGTISVSRQATYDIWTARNVPPIVTEEGIPPTVELASGVLVWEGERRWDWATMGKTYYKWFTHYGRYPSDPRELAAKLVEGISNPRERAKAIHGWIKQNLNIQSFETLTPVPRQTEITPVKAAKILEEKNATPEQAASLMWLMLQAVGVNATLVLATDSYHLPVEEGLPFLYQFTHSLLALDDGTLIDTTDRYVPFGSLPWTFEGRKALWIKGDSVSFKNIPESRPEDNWTKAAVAGTLAPDGGAKIEVKFGLGGQMAFSVRKKVVPMNPKEREEWVRNRVTDVVEKAELDQFEFTNLENPDQPLELLLKFHVPGYAQVAGDKLLLKLGAFIQPSVCPELSTPDDPECSMCPTPSTETRANPVRFPFKRLDELEANISFPIGFLLQALPKGFRTREIEKGTLLGVQTSYGSPDSKSLNVIRKFSVNELFVAKDGYPNLRDLVRRYLAQKDVLVTLELPKLID